MVNSGKHVIAVMAVQAGQVVLTRLRVISGMVVDRSSQLMVLAVLVRRFFTGTVLLSLLPVMVCTRTCPPLVAISLSSCC